MIIDAFVILVKSHFRLIIIIIIISLFFIDQCAMPNHNKPYLLSWTHGWMDRRIKIQCRPRPTLCDEGEDQPKDVVNLAYTLQGCSHTYNIRTLCNSCITQVILTSQMSVYSPIQAQSKMYHHGPSFVTLSMLKD